MQLTILADIWCSRERLQTTKIIGDETYERPQKIVRMKPRKSFESLFACRVNLIQFYHESNFPEKKRPNFPFQHSINLSTKPSQLCKGSICCTHKYIGTTKRVNCQNIASDYLHRTLQKSNLTFVSHCVNDVYELWAQKYAPGSFATGGYERERTPNGGEGGELFEWSSPSSLALSV